MGDFEWEAAGNAADLIKPSLEGGKLNKDI